MVMVQNNLKLTNKAIKEFDKARNSRTTTYVGKSKYGTHFYNYFRLDKIVDQSEVSKLKDLDEKEAKELIKQIFVLT